MTGQSRDAQNLEDLSFEQLVSELEEATQRLASAELGIEEAAEVYERAEALHAAASERLAKVQERIDRLTKSH